MDVPPFRQNDRYDTTARGPSQWAGAQLLRDRLADAARQLVEPPREVVVGALDGYHARPAGKRRGQRHHQGQRPELVLAPLDDRERFPAFPQKAEADKIDRQPDADQRRHPLVPGASVERDVGPERVSGDEERLVGIQPGEVIHHRLQIVLLAPPAVVFSAAATDAAEIETQGRETGAHDRLGRGVHDLVVHRPAEQRMRMADHSGRRRRRSATRPGRRIGPLQHALDPAGGAREEETLDPRHARGILTSALERRRKEDPRAQAPTSARLRSARRARRVTYSVTARVAARPVAHMAYSAGVRRAWPAAAWATARPAKPR